METNNEIFPKTFSKCVSALFKIKGSLTGRDIIISIDPTQDINYASTECANQLLIFESNIIETIFFETSDKHYDITNLRLSIGDYTFIQQFNIKTFCCDNSDIILGSPWMESLGSFILNMKKKFLTFSYRKKKITLQTITLNSDSVTPKDFQDTSKVIFQEIKSNTKYAKGS